MTISLPDYAPPSDRRAGLAAGAAPLAVLITFTLLVARVIEPDTGFAVFVACTIWVMWEMHDYQRAIDAYDARYVDRHLAWRSGDALRALLDAGCPSAPTRSFVERFIAGVRVRRPDGLLS